MPGWRFLPGCHDLSFGPVDVRDVADLHLMAMTDPAARSNGRLPNHARHSTGLDR